MEGTRAGRETGRVAEGREGGTNLLSGIESDVLLVEVLIQFEDRGDVPAPIRLLSSVYRSSEEEGKGKKGEGKRKGEGVNEPVAVIWRTPDGDDLVVEHEFVTFHDLLAGIC